MSSLREYNRKRDFKKTAEPSGKVARGRGTHRFVIQKHAASRLHYDFRLEMSGTLKSWAVPKGLPYSHGEKRLAVHVEDHPVSYIDFEGTIPEGEYGGGTVMVWDRGTYEALSKAPTKELAGGKLHFVLHGEKLEGEWYLVQMHGRGDGDEDNQWLIIRGGEDLKPITKKADDTSVLSGKSMKELAAGDRVWTSNRAASAPVKKKATPQRKAKPLPVPAFIEPMAAKLVAQAPAGGEWIYEIKFDGWRALALCGTDETRLVSRNEKELGAKFPKLLEAFAALEVRDAVIDGEIVALDPEGRSTFQLLQAYDLGQEKPPLYFYAFDLLRLDGKDLTALPLTERKERLEALLAHPPEGIRYSASLGADAGPLLKQAGKLGLEGLIGKLADSKYEVGRRSGAWIKLKLQHEQEMVIGGFTPPEGARKHFGALILGVYSEKGELVYAGKCGTGFSHKMLLELHKRMTALKRKTCPFADLPEPRGHRYSQGITQAEMSKCTWLTPQLVAQVRFTEWTQDGRLRHPAFLGLREDKSAKDVVRERAA